ncbi:mCG3705, isoform CRA_a [Mus musculus]|nr:mCG3705, isoform CRA_a [Mus musculus]
MAKDVWYLL